MIKKSLTGLLGIASLFVILGLNAKPANEVALGHFSLEVSVTAVPEPSSCALIGGLAGLLAAGLRRRRR